MLEIKKLPKGNLFDVEFLDVNTVPESIQPHRHEYFEIFWVLSGNGLQSIDFVEYVMSPKQMFFITPGQVHDVHKLPENIYAISFNAEFIDSNLKTQIPIESLFIRNRSGKPYITLDKIGVSHLLGLIKIIDDELTLNLPNRDLMSNLLVSFLQYVVRYLESETHSEPIKDERVLNALKLIDEHFISHKDATFYSEKLAMTNKRLNELIKNQFGKTITQLIHNKVIVEAKRLLAFSDKTIKTISYELGYEDASYFCRFFKKHCGISPQSFREQRLEN